MLLKEIGESRFRMANATVNQLVEAFGKAFSDREKDLSIRIFEPYLAIIQSQKDELEKKEKEIEKYKVDVNANSKTVALKDAKIAELEKELNNLKIAHENEKKQIDPLANIHTSVIHARFPNISKLTSTVVTSGWTTIDNKKWAIRICKDDDFLDVYLFQEYNNNQYYYNNQVSPTTSVQCKIHLISQTSVKNSKTATWDQFYNLNSKQQSQGYRVITWKDLFDETKGYVKDDAINVTIEFKAFSAT